MCESRWVNRTLEKRVELLSRLARRDEVVILWDSPGIIFTVSFLQMKKGQGEPTNPELGWSRRWVVESSISGNEVLAYFDYEGAWARWALGEAPQAYPRGLPRYLKGSTARSRKFRAEDIAELVLRPISGTEDENGGLWPLAGGLPRRLQSLVDLGQVIPWIIPDLAKVPGLPQRELEHIVLTSGRWKTDCAGAQLFQQLVSRSRATPFLYAYRREPHNHGVLGSGTHGLHRRTDSHRGSAGRVSSRNRGYQRTRRLDHHGRESPV